MAGLKVPTYERQTRFVSAYRGPTASPQAFGSDIGKGLTTLGAGITDVGLAQMQRAAQRQEAVDLDKQQTFRLGLNDDVHRDVLTNKDAATVAEGNPTEDAQGRWKKLAEARLEGMLKSGDRPSPRAVQKMRRDAQLIQAEYTEAHLNMVDQGRRMNTVSSAGRNLQLIHASAAEHGNLNAQTAEQAEALAVLQKTLPPEQYLAVEEQARLGMGKAVIEHLVRVQDQGLLAKDDAQRESIEADAYKLIDEASTLGYIEGSSVAETKRIWTEQFDQRAAASLDATSRVAALGGGVAVADAGAYSYLHSKLAAHQESTHVTNFRGDFAKSLAGFLQAAPPGLGILSGARTYADQARLYKEYKEDLAAGLHPSPVAPPGSSQHNKGNATDLSWNGERFSKAPPEVKEWVAEHAAEFGLGFPVAGEPWHIEGPREGSPERRKSLIDAMVQVESGGQADAISPAGAIGILQVMPGTAKEIAREMGDVNFPATGGESDIRKYLSNRETGMRYGQHYMQKMLEKYGGDVEVALIAYNGGPARADAYLAAGRDFAKAGTPAETRAYVGKVMNAMGGAAVAGAGAADLGIYGPQGNSFDAMAADVRRRMIEGAQGEMARGSATLKSGVEDYIGWLRAGNQPDGRYSLEELSYRMGAQLGEEASAQIAAAAAYGQKAQSLGMATPEQVQAIREENASALSSPEGFKQNAIDAAGLETIIAERQKLLDTDPGGYVADKDKDTRAAIEKASRRGLTPQQQQAAAFEWAGASLRAQDILGIPKDQQSILPDLKAQQIGAQFSSKQPGGQNAAELLEGLEKQWGKYWEPIAEQLIRDDLIPGTAKVLVTMNRPSQNVARSILAEAATVGTEALEKAVTPQTVTDIKAELHTTTADFAATLASNGVSGVNTYNTFTESIKQLALTYARTEGLNASAALAKAKSEILDKAYTFMDTYRVPIEMDAEAINQRAEDFQQRIDPAELMQPASSAGINPDDVQAAYHTQVTSNGYWVTSASEDGLTLYDETGAAVRRKDGKPYTVSWKELTATTAIEGPSGPMTYPSIVLEEGADAEATLSDTGAEAEAAGAVPDYAGQPSAAVASRDTSSPPAATTTEPQERALSNTEPQPREARTAADRITSAERNVLARGVTLEQSSSLARSGGTYGDILVALTGSATPTRETVEKLLRDMETTMPDDPLKQQIIEKLRLAGRAIR